MSILLIDVAGRGQIILNHTGLFCGRVKARGGDKKQPAIATWCQVVLFIYVISP